MDRRYALRCLAILILCCSPPTLAGWEPQGASLFDARTISKRLIPSVVELYIFDQDGNKLKEGSGFILTKNGLIATNFHVIDEGYSAKAILNNGDAATVEGVMEFDPAKDFAILKINAVELPWALLGNSDLLEPGENLVAIGAPLGLSYTVTTGIVSQIRLQDEYRLIQHSAPISPGSSGGPLVNSKGQVVGINTSHIEGGNSIFFALPINYVRAALENSKGELYPLDKLSAAVTAAREQMATEKLKAIITKTFLKYDDPEGQFSVLVPRRWPVQTSEKETNEGGYTRHVFFMASSPDAELAKINGWLSEGVRIHMQCPQQGMEWRMSGIDEWYKSEFKSTFAGYDKFEATEPRDVKFGNADSKSAVVVGTSTKLSRPEMSVLYLNANPHCLMTIEVTMPADKKEELKVVKTILEASFKANWLK